MVLCILSPPVVVPGAAVVDPPFTAGLEDSGAAPGAPPPVWASAKVEDMAKADANAIVFSFIIGVSSVADRGAASPWRSKAVGRVIGAKRDPVFNQTRYYWMCSKTLASRWSVGRPCSSPSFFHPSTNRRM